jgi:hypothetical protein
MRGDCVCVWRMISSEGTNRVVRSVCVVELRTKELCLSIYMMRVSMFIISNLLSLIFNL